jgi:Domain of unknown function (DUF6883)
MKLPNAQDAVVDLKKLTDYLLNPDHPRGKHKARVLEAKCGITVDHADLLRRELIEVAKQAEAKPTRTDTDGRRFVLEWNISGPRGTATLVTAWIVRAGENFPRFVSAYVR